MSVNKFHPHVLVIPEDDANREIAKGFEISLQQNCRQFQVLPPPGGWAKVLEVLESVHIPEMERIPNRSVVLIVDFDKRATRCSEFKKVVPERLLERVFIVGVWSEPEQLKGEFGGFEKLGEALADDCRTEGNQAWSHDLINHNAAELARMKERLRTIFFHQS